MVFPTSVWNDTTAAALVFHKEPEMNYREKLPDKTTTTEMDTVIVFY